MCLCVRVCHVIVLQRLEYGFCAEIVGERTDTIENTTTLGKCDRSSLKFVAFFETAFTMFVRPPHWQRVRSSTPTAYCYSPSIFGVLSFIDLSAAYSLKILLEFLSESHNFFVVVVIVILSTRVRARAYFSFSIPFIVMAIGSPVSKGT